MLITRFFTALLLVGGAVPAHAIETAVAPSGPAPPTGCWAMLFEDNDFDPKDPNIRVDGPQELASLENLGGRNWGDDIQSIVVGPDATVEVYDKKDFRGAQVVLQPGQKVADLGKFDMRNAINSMKISCRMSSNIQSSQPGVPGYLLLPVPARATASPERHTLWDNTVTDLEGRPVGSLERMVMDPQTGKIEYGIVSLSANDRLVPIPWTAFKINRDTGNVALKVTRDELNHYLSLEGPNELQPGIRQLMHELEETHAQRHRQPNGRSMPPRAPAEGSPGGQMPGEPQGGTRVK